MSQRKISIGRRSVDNMPKDINDWVNKKDDVPTSKDNMKETTVRTSLVLPKSLHKSLRFDALEKNISLNELLNSILMEHMKKQ